MTARSAHFERTLVLVAVIVGCSRGRAGPRSPPVVEPAPSATTEIQVDGCRWLEIPDRAGAGMKPGGATLECSVTHIGPTTWKYMVWTARDAGGAKVDEGASGGSIWKQRGERRRVIIDLAKGASDRTARIEIQPE